MARAAVRPRAGLTALLAAKEMVLVCGSGGVGKTTAAAAMAVQAAQDAGLASACHIEGGIAAWKKAAGPLTH